MQNEKKELLSKINNKAVLSIDGVPFQKYNN